MPIEGRSKGEKGTSSYVYIALYVGVDFVYTLYNKGQELPVPL